MYCSQLHLYYINCEDLGTFLLMALSSSARSFTFRFTYFLLGKMEFICLCLPLLPDKRQSTYEKILNILHSECFEQQTTFKPEHIHFDLKVGMMNAFTISWPSSTIKSCQFHVAQAWYRFINQVGLSSVYKSMTLSSG